MTRSTGTVRGGVPGSSGTASRAPRSARPVAEFDPLTISDEELKALAPADRAKVYKARAVARAGGAAPGAPSAGAPAQPSTTAPAAAPKAESAPRGGTEQAAAPETET